MAVGSVDTLYIIDVASGTIAQEMRLPGVSDAHWMDEETLLIGTNTGLFGTISISTPDFVENTRASLRRSFTAQECAIYRIDPCPTLAQIRGR
jgi:hypothetical protein